MAANPRDSQDDALAREVDRLLKKLPGADPMLRGDPSPRIPVAHHPRPGAAPGSAGVQHAPAPSVSPVAQRIGVWLRVGLGAGLAVAVTQWPYARSCGFPLYSYLAATGVVAVTGVWAALWSWRLRLGIAHTASLVVLFFGTALFVAQVLPRVGYAAEAATWTCQ